MTNPIKKVLHNHNLNQTLDKMSQYRFEFVTGCPGSGWSNITHSVRCHLKEFYDISDLKDYRHYKVPDDYYKKRGAQIGAQIDPATLPDNHKLTHFGSYFGPATEYGQGFDCIRKNYSRDEFIKECLLPFDSSSTAIKQIKSHWFAYNLDWLWENFKGHHLLLVWRNPDICYTHWQWFGGWDITYPKYDWYRQFDNMHNQIKKEADLVLNFINRKNLQLVECNDSQWFNKCYSEFNKTVQDLPPSYNNLGSVVKIARIVIQ